MKPILFDSTALPPYDNFGIGTLKDAISCTVTEELNGMFELEMQYPVSGAYFNDIAIRSIIYAPIKPKLRYQGFSCQPFRVYAITKSADEHTATIFARHLMYDYNGVPVEPFSGTDFDDFLDNIVPLVSSEFVYTLADGQGTYYPNAQGEITEVTSLGGVFEYLTGAPYYCEIQFSGTVLYIWAHRGQDRGFAIKYGKNLTSLQQDMNCADLYTGVYVYYISGTGVVTGKIVRVSGYSYDNLLPVNVTDQFDDTPSSAQLTAAGNKYISENNVGVPDVTLTVSFVQKHSNGELINSEVVEIGDDVKVIFEALGVTASVRVIRTVYDVIADRLIEISVGKPDATLSGTIATSVSKTDKTADSYKQTQNVVDKYCLQYREQITNGSLDSINHQGHYYVTTANVGNVSGAPSGLSVGYNVIHFNSTGSRIMQILYTNSASLTRFYWRICTSGGSWSPWVAVTNDTPIDISSALGTVTPGTGMASCTITDAYYCHGYVTLRLGPKTSGSLASNGEMSGTISFPPEYAPKMTTNGIGFYTSHACVARITSSGTVTIRNTSTTAIADGNTVYTTITFPCG